jgi:hypothetical protein
MLGAAAIRRCGLPSFVGVVVLNALLNLPNGLLRQLQCSLTMATFGGTSALEFLLSLPEMFEGSGHVRFPAFVLACNLVGILCSSDCRGERGRGDQEERCKACKQSGMHVRAPFQLGFEAG